MLFSVCRTFNEHFMNSYVWITAGYQPFECCHSVYINIAEFYAFNAAQITNNETLQNILMNMTHNAIASSSADNGVPRNEIWMRFSNASGALCIECNMCTWSVLHLTALKYVIQNEDDEINSAMQQNFNTSTTVAVSLNKFGLYIATLTIDKIECILIGRQMHRLLSLLWNPLSTRR